MLTIGQLAAYAGVTVRAVRHYHQVGLLPEPERDRSGYRSYNAVAAIQLIRIRTLAEAGVPLARVHELLEASEEEFATAVAEIDQRLRAEIRELQQHRRRVAQLAAGDALVLPADVVTYLDRMRAAGAPEAMVEGERDGWILVAARWPEKIPELMVEKTAALEDPRVIRLYQLIGTLIEGDADEEQLGLVADLMSELSTEAAERGELDRHTADFDDDTFVDLIDAFASEAHPVVDRLQELMAERGWKGWTRMERAET